MNIASILLAILLIVQGMVILFGLSFEGIRFLTGVLALAAGLLMFFPFGRRTLPLWERDNRRRS